MNCLNCGKEPGYNGTENWTETALGERICPQCLEIYLDPAAKKAFRAEEKEVRRAKDTTKAFRGMAAEKRVSQSLEQCYEETGAVLFKLPVECKLIGGRRIYTARSMSDFVGFARDGHFVGIEVKSVQGNSIPPSAIRPNQAAFLDHLGATANGAAYILADFRDSGRWFMIDWSDWCLWKGARLSNDAMIARGCEVDPLRFWRYLDVGETNVF